MFCFLLFPEQEDVFLYPYSLNFYIYVKNIKFIFTAIPDTICKITGLAEDLTQLHYSVKSMLNPEKKAFSPELSQRKKLKSFKQ